ncbi:MAG: pantoate--beta-alanine ligase [Rubripirellula sp.]
MEIGEMEILYTPADARRYVLQRQREGESVAVVPTMGALHDGHLSLVEIGKQQCDRAAATIFVNPTQFAPHEDLDQYPRTLEQDLQRLQSLGTDAVFVPEVAAMYPDGCSTSIVPPRVANRLEGQHRPEHFGGVCTIVLKLFQCLPCDVAVFGRKDYQQWRVIESMVADLNLPVKVVAGEIVRDPDGLAMSSRNRYLSVAERQSALVIPQALDQLVSQVTQGQKDVALLQANLLRSLDGGGIEDSARVDSVDYAVIVDAKTLEPILELDRPAVALIAARVGATRLIDNRLIEV